MTDINQKVQDALTGFETFKTDLAAKMGKLDAFDAKKFEDIQTAIGDAMQLTQDLKAEKAEREKLEAKMESIEEKGKLLEAALNRPSLAITPESKAKELAALGTKTFNQFARMKGENRVPFEEFLQKSSLDEAEKKALSVGSDPDGGYLATPQFEGIINTFVYESSPLRQMATVLDVDSGSIEYMTDNDQAGWGWVSEKEARPVTYTPQIGMMTINVYEMYANPAATKTIIQDSRIDIEKWLADKVGDVFSRAEGSAFVAGNGVGKPRGILSYDAGSSINSQQVEQVNMGSASAVTMQGLISLAGGLKEPYQRNASFLMNRSAWTSLLGMQNSIDGGFYLNQNYDKNPGVEGFIMGKPIYFAADMPGVTANSTPIAYGDWKKAYVILDRQGIEVLRDPYTQKPFVLFYTTKRVGGGVVNFEAYKLGKIAV